MNSLFVFLTVVQALVGAGLVGVILMQKSEGGGLGMGGSPTGLMSARGAADFITRATVVLSTLVADRRLETCTAGDSPKKFGSVYTTATTSAAIKIAYFQTG